MTTRQVLNSMDSKELVEWDVWLNPKKWQRKLEETDDARSNLIFNLVMKSNG
jgi:hypothetical protein